MPIALMGTAFANFVSFFNQSACWFFATRRSILCDIHTPSRTLYFRSVCTVHTKPHLGMYLPRYYYPTKNFCNFCRTLIPVPGTYRSSVRRCHKDPGYGYRMFIPARNFGNFCTPVPQYPDVLDVLKDFHTPTRNFRRFCNSFIPVPGTSVSSVCLCHNTRNFWKFWNTSIHVPETSECSVRSPYPYPESTNPAELISRQS